METSVNKLGQRQIRVEFSAKWLMCFARMGGPYPSSMTGTLELGTGPAEMVDTCPQAGLPFWPGRRCP